MATEYTEEHGLRALFFRGFRGYQDNQSVLVPIMGVRRYQVEEFCCFFALRLKFLYAPSPNLRRRAAAHNFI
jgi:hypothetical protein